MRFLHIIFLCIASLTSFASNPYIVNIDKQTYGGASKNWNIREDELGFVYVANDNGLLQFDGINWTLSTMPNHDPVKSLYVKSHQMVYVGGFEEFGCWQRDEMGILTYTSLSNDIPRDEIKNNDFWQIWENNGYIYFQSFQGIYAHKDGTTIRLAIPNPVLFLLQADQELWFQQMKKSLYRLNGIESQLIKGSEVLEGVDIRVVLPLSDKKYLIGTANQGLYTYAEGKFEKWNSEISQRVAAKELNCGIVTTDGKYLLGTISDGIYVTDLSGKILNHFSIDKQLKNNTILSLFQSKNGSVWVGLDSGIANIQYLNNMSYYSFEKNDIGTIYDAKIWNDKLFICTNQGVYYMTQNDLFNDKSLSNIRLIDGTQGQAWALSVIDGELYCSHNRGLKKILPNLHSTTYLDTWVGTFNFTKDKLYGQDVLLASTYTHLSVYDKQGEKIDVGEKDVPVKQALIDHLNNIWMKVPYKGIYKYRLDENLKTTADSIYFGSETDTSMTSNLNMFKIGGRVMLADDSIFYIYDEIENKIKRNDIVNKCLSPIANIKNIVEIKENYYWIITSSSIHQLFYNGYVAQIVDQYSLSTHQLSLVERYENISILNDSLNLICLDNGFLLYNQKVKVKQYFLVPPSILSASSHNQEGDVKTHAIRQADTPLQIEADQSYLLSIQVYNPNSFYRNEAFQYQLEGVDTKWNTLLQSNNITYERLPGGQYTLLVRSVNKLGEVSDTAQLSIEILNPFYKTPLAAFIGLLLLGCLFYLIWMLILKRHRNIHLKKVRLRERNRLRQLNSKLEKEIFKVNSELFTRTNLILQKNKLFQDIKDILDNFYRKGNNKDLTTLHKRLYNMLNTSIEGEGNWEMILVSFEQKHPNFFNNLKKISPDLTPNDLRLCVSLRLNFDSKEIAEMMNLSVRTVDNNRSRLRKKLLVPQNVHLTDFLLDL